ncbi:MAG: phosphate ABC transporter permease subunit PstC [Nitrososphaerota archaeon]|nr:phosphate ABC transporter permease subunit PstC [Nitrososphaerota archaeon]
MSDRIYKYVTALFATSAPLSIFVIFLILIVFAFPSIIVNGFHYFTSIIWNPRLNGSLLTVHWFGFNFHTLEGASYGLLVFLVGTLISSGLAILFGLPVGVGIAILISQFVSKKIAPPISFFVELLAGVPSVIFGFWGIQVLAPFVSSVEKEVLLKYLFFIPGFGGRFYNPGLMDAGLILALMIVPIIASMSRDAMIQAPQELRDGARALGLTDWEVTQKIVLPYAKVGIFGSAILGLGRALGETMAVAMVAGGAINILPTNVYSPLQTMAGFMAVQLDSAFTDPSGMAVSALMELAFVLSIITILVNVVARLIIRQGFFKESGSVMRV